jgi:hypothetical protein
MKALSPLVAVRQHCLECCGGSAHEVARCPARACPLWTMRFGTRPDPADHVADPKPIHPLEHEATLASFASMGLPTLAAIKRRCLDCSGGSAQVRSCNRRQCDLWAFRLGSNPNRAGIPNRGHFGRKLPAHAPVAPIGEPVSGVTPANTDEPQNAT